jgi:ligand-binding sensor domain-containing protein
MGPDPVIRRSFAMNERRWRNMVAACGLAMTASTALAQNGTAQWVQVRPGNTGIPGIQLHYGTLAPDGKVWVAGRWPFWGEGGYGVFDPATDLWETYSNYDDPQPSQWARGVIFAPGGVIWMATDDGLVRKEGENWTVYTTANSPLLHNKIRNIALAPDGKLWVNNSGVNMTSAALFSFDGTTWSQPYNVGDEIPFAMPWNQLGVVLVTPNNHVWISNDTLNGIVEHNPATGTWTMRGQNIGRFGSGLVDQNGHLWLLAGVGGGNQFWRYRPVENLWNQWSSANTPLVNTTITKLDMDGQGRIYAGNWFGQVIRFDGAAWTQVANVGDAVYGIGVEPDGDMWVATLGNGQTGELHRLDAGGAPIHRYNTWNTGMPDYFVDRMSLDPQGNLWIATGEAGLSRLDTHAGDLANARWRNWGNHNSGSEPYPFAGNEPMGAYFQDSQGRGWMGGNGIAQWDPASGQFLNFWNWQSNPGMGVTNFSSFAETSGGELFAADDYGATFRFNGSLWQQQPTSAGSYTSSYSGVKTDPQGRVWSIGWLKAWLHENGVWTEVGQSWDIFNKGGVNAYEFDASGNLWLGTNEGLLIVQNPPNGPTTFYTPANSPLPAPQVQGIDMRASDGTMALSSHLFQSTTPFPSGVAVISGSPDVAANWRIYRYGQDPVAHYQLGAVQYDRAGNLWISATSLGCSVLMNSGGTPSCYGNCDGSTAAPVLNVADFTCFLQRFAAGDSWANCDGSTATPTLNVADFTCFLQRFAAGCP